MEHKAVYTAIPEDQKRGWKAHNLITGEEINLPPLFKLGNDRFNLHVVYGSAGAYDAACIQDGGGAVMMGWHKAQDGQVYVTVLEQNRPLMGGPVLNAPRGFKNVNEDPKVTAAREAGEEVSGINIVDVTQMEGESVNMNSALFDTVHGGSVQFCAMQLPSDVVIEDENGVCFSDEVKPISSNAEKMLSCKLIPVWDAIELACGMTALAAGRLIGHLRKAGVITVS